jgi:quinoprotein dehydrogenase-associated probable ABC transporter substrate-binding protein
MSLASSLRPALLAYTLTAVLVVIAVAAATAFDRRAPVRQAVVHLAVPPVIDPAPEPADPAMLRVCADPNNLPYSNQRQEGFENAIARLVALDLHRQLHYVWQPQRRGFIRTTLKAGACDLVMSVPAGVEVAATTIPYYRSSYVFITRTGLAGRVRTLDDPRLHRMRIGVQIVGDDYDNPPPVQALAARHLSANVRGYTVYGNYATDAPQRRIVDAVAEGEVDVAIAWGPLAGYFAGRLPVPLEIRPVPPVHDVATPFGFDMAMAVRHDDHALLQALNATIARRRSEVRQILERFGVPLGG